MRKWEQPDFFRTPTSADDAKAQLRKEKKLLKRAQVALSEAEAAKYSLGVKIAEDDIALRTASIAHFETWLQNAGGTPERHHAAKKAKKSSAQLDREIRQFLESSDQEVVSTGPFYYLDYREALQRAKRLAVQTNSKIRVATGMDERAPKRVEYVVAKVGDVPSNFTVVAFADPTGNIESSGSRYQRMMERRRSS